MSDELMTLKEAGGYLKVSYPTMYRWIYSDKIPCHKLNGLWRFYKSELDEHIKGESDEAQEHHAR